MLLKIIKSQIAICFVLIFLVITGCNQEKTMQIYPDPFSDSFRGKNIRLVIAHHVDSPLLKDTIFLDKDGSINMRKEYWATIRYAYDSLNLPVRILSMNDVPSNYHIEYVNEEKYLLQKWYPIKHLRWVFEKSDLDSVERVVKFELNEKGKVIKEIDATSESEINFHYNDDGRLVLKEMFSEGRESPAILCNYEYDSKKVITKMECTRSEDLIIGHYYSRGGLLDSSVVNNSIKKYQYEYY